MTFDRNFCKESSELVSCCGCEWVNEGGESIFLHRWPWHLQNKSTEGWVWVRGAEVHSRCCTVLSTSQQTQRRRAQKGRSVLTNLTVCLLLVMSVHLVLFSCLPLDQSGIFGNFLLSPLLLLRYIPFLSLSVIALVFVIYTFSLLQFLYNIGSCCLQCKTSQQHIFISPLSFLVLWLSHITSPRAVNLRDIMTFSLQSLIF